MTRISFLVAAMVALMLAMPGARASDCSVDPYDHNGSRMEVQICDPGGSVNIVYTNPRQGLRPHGVRNGTLLFDGVSQRNGVISGQARLFNRRCGAITYAVSGTMNQAGTIVLHGSAPVRGSNCRVTRHRSDRLVFTLLGGGGGQTVRPTCPPGFVLSGGNCVRGQAAPRPTCPRGFVFSNGQCVPSGVPHPPVQSGGDWHAIAGSFQTERQARSRASGLGGNWYVMNTRDCPNFRNGFWIATAGPTSKGQAQAFANRARRHGAYVKTCH